MGHSSGAWEVQEHGSDICLASDEGLLTVSSHGKRWKGRDSEREQEGAELAFITKPLSWKQSYSHNNGINPFMRTEPSWPNYFLKVPNVNTVALGIKFQHMNLGSTFKPYMLSLTRQTHVLLICKMHSFHPSKPKSLNMFQHQLRTPKSITSSKSAMGKTQGTFILRQIPL